MTISSSNFISTRSRIPLNLIDDYIYLDTNILLTLYKKVTPNNVLGQDKIHYYNDINRFINQVIKSDKLLFYSHHGIEEFNSVLTQKMQDNYKGSQGLNSIKEIPKSEMIRINTMAYKEISNFESSVINNIGDKLSYSNSYVDSEGVKIALQDGVTGPDAKHIAIARENDINSIFTNDGDFVNATGLNIYGSSFKIHQESMKNNPTSLRLSN
ncbi:type II toxin-antitoxin system VapC family toxin [Macrococcus equipercicus]|uniref:PIN domain-containing protein n=1 Tax=Macrococcus equipercicus TaxID=69967 RepID=A0A9Q9BVR5_9STAP|nr:PIN domain-containing protein [Macrococcus equipercicus]UTH13282.1 PIN domain-containing protein [Macrococcus equipercicus]